MTREKMTEIGKRLARVRRKLNLTQEEMASKMSITQASYSRYEAGYNQPSWECVQVLKETYDINSDWLYSGVGDMFVTHKRQDTPPDTEAKINELINENVLLKKDVQKLDIQNREMGDELRARLTELLEFHKKKLYPA
jgi:transcriptional regulator with XRE-family HTH domain